MEYKSSELQSWQQPTKWLETDKYVCILFIYFENKASVKIYI